MSKIKVAICGGGNIAHAVLVRLSQNPDIEVSLFTRSPEKWNDLLVMTTSNNEKFVGKIKTISNHPKDVVSIADIVILTQPSFVRLEILKQIAPFLKSKVLLGAFPGIGCFNWQVKQAGIKTTNDLIVFSAQRVPCISRIVEYGYSVHADFKSEIFVAISKNSDSAKSLELLTFALGMNVLLLNNFLEVNLSTSNPILHPSRIYSAFLGFEDGRRWAEPVLFYENWDMHASETLISMDNDVHKLIGNIAASLKGIKPIIQHYGVSDAYTLTKKIQQIPAFKGIKTPMIQDNGGWLPDVKSRYFTEDIPYGLVLIKAIAIVMNTEVPTIDRVLAWFQQVMGITWITNSGQITSMCKDLPIPTMDDILYEISVSE